MNDHDTSIEILASQEMQPIAQNVYRALKEKDPRFGYADVTCMVFPNGELKPHIPKTIREKDIFLFHSLSFPDPNIAFMKLMLTADSIMRSDANRLTLV